MTGDSSIEWRPEISEGAPIHFGVSLRPSYTTWPALREWSRRVEALGYDSLWTSDHFIGDERDLDAPYFEGWQLLPAWGALTERIRIGMLVSGNTYRHPAILAKMAATATACGLDQVVPWMRSLRGWRRTAGLASEVSSSTCLAHSTRRR